jgi:general secretion pathway protein G
VLETERGDRSRRTESGLTYIEMYVALAVLLVLAISIIPLKRWDDRRRREAHLRRTLETVREAIDAYKKYSEEGLIVQTDVEQMGYPLSLEELVEGVEVGDPNSPDAKTVRFLRRIPVDPMTEEEEWGLRSYQDDWDSDSWGGENVYDIYSLARGTALDGTEYSDW